MNNFVTLFIITVLLFLHAIFFEIQLERLNDKMSVNNQRTYGVELAVQAAIQYVLDKN